jgi:hypothetical protein
MKPEDQQIKSQTIKEDVNNSALLSKTEIQWLIDNVKVSKSFEYKMRNSIKRKLLDVATSV